MRRELSRLLRPRSIAVIGGGAVCRHVMENCARLGFAGPVWHVHPTRGDVAELAALPEAPDLAFVGINRAATIDAVAELAAMGAGGAVAYASGFAEAEAEMGDGAQMQARLLEAAGEMPLIGPNCYGFLNYLDGAGLWPDQQGGHAVARGVAIITQSSNIAINLSMQRRGLPIAYLATAGNQAQLGLAELGAALIADARVTALGLHIEGVGDLAAFQALAAAARRAGKPVVALKAGRSAQAQAAAVSHTASLAGSAAGADALFARLGIAQVRTLPELLEALKLLHVHGPLASGRIASMSCSGGEASLMADLAEGRAGLAFPPLDRAQTDALRAALGPRVALANPLDYHTYIWGDTPAMGAAYAAMMQGDLALGCVVADFPRADRCSDADWEPVIKGVAHAARASGRPMAIVSSLPETLSEATAERLIGMGIAPLNGMAEALAAIEAGVAAGRPLAEQAPVLSPGGPRAARLLTEAEAKERLARCGMDVPRAMRCDRTGLAQAAAEIGFPCVLKAEGIAHKTEAGGVALNLRSAEELLDAASGMPGQGFLVEEMVTGGLAELLLGVTRDAAHGFVLTLGAGGTLTELLGDSVSLLVPAAEQDLRAALAGLRIAPLLAGWRGAPAADIDAIMAAIGAVQSFVIENSSLVEEVEVNPLICTPRRAIAADALIRMGDPDE